MGLELDQRARDEIYRLTREAVARGRGISPDEVDRQAIGCCLDFAYEGYRIINAWPGAPRTIVQAGSASWRRVTHEQDDGVSPTHFAYVWDPDSPLARLARSGGLATVVLRDGTAALTLPEVHVWLGCPETGEIIDFTTGLWPSLCEKVLGQSWPAPQPPAYLWCRGGDLPEAAGYRPERSAIETIVSLLRACDRQYP